MKKQSVKKCMEKGKGGWKEGLLAAWEFHGGHSLYNHPSGCLHAQRGEQFLPEVRSVFSWYSCYSLCDVVPDLSLPFWLLVPSSLTLCEHHLFSAGLGAPGDIPHLSCPLYCRSKCLWVVISLDVKLKEMEWFHFLFAFTLTSLWMLLVDVFIKDALMSKYK